MVSLPAMGALSPRVEMRFCVGLILSERKSLYEWNVITHLKP
jgi:hypothetical protein